MAVIDTIREAQDRSIEELTNAQERLAELNERVAEGISGIVPRFENPFAEYLPSPSQVVESYFDFVGKLYEANKSFSQRVAAAWERPEGSTAKPAAKTTPKAAPKATGSSTKS